MDAPPPIHNRGVVFMGALRVPVADAVKAVLSSHRVKSDHARVVIGQFTTMFNLPRLDEMSLAFRAKFDSDFDATWQSDATGELTTIITAGSAYRLPLSLERMRRIALAKIALETYWKLLYDESLWPFVATQPPTGTTELNPLTGAQ